MSHPQTSNLKRKSNFPSAPSPSPSNPSALRSDRAESLSIPPSLPPDGSQIDATLLLNPRTMSNISCLLQSDLPAYELPAIQETSKQTECTTLQPSTSLRLEVMSGNGTVNGAELARARELQELHDLLEDTELVQFVRIADWTVDDLSILIRAKMNDLSWPVIADIIGDDRTVGDCKEIYFRLTLFCRRRRAINQTLQSIASSAQITRLESPIEPPALPSQREDNVEESPSASALQIVQYQSAVTSRPARQQSLAKVSPQKSPAKKTVRKRRGTGSATSQVIATAASNLAAESLESNDRPNQTAEIKGETEQTPHHTAHSELNSEEHPPAARPSLAENSAKDTAAGAENSAAQTLLSAASITETAPDSLSRSPNQRAGQKVTEKVRVVCPPSTSGQQTDPAETGSQELSGQTTSSQPGPEDSPRQTTPSLPATEKPLGRTTPSQPVTEESSGHMFGSPFNDLESIAVEFPAGARVIRVSAIDETSSVSKNEVPEVPETLREVELNSGPSVIERPVGESPQNKEMSSASGRSQAAADSGTDVTKRKPMGNAKLNNIMRDKDLVSTIVTLRNENNRFSALAHVLSDYSATERLTADLIEKVYKRATRGLTSATADITDREELSDATAAKSGDDTIDEDGDDKLYSLGESEQYDLLELKNRNAPREDVLKKFPKHDEHALLEYYESLEFEMLGSRRQRGYVPTKVYLRQVRRRDSISFSSKKKKDDGRRKNSSVGRPAKKARPNAENSKKKTETVAPSADASLTDNGYLTSSEEGEIIEPATQRTSGTKKTTETSQRANGPTSDFRILLRLAKKPESPVSSPPSTMLRWRRKSANHATLSAINQGTETLISGVQNSQGGTTSSPVQSRGAVKKKPESSVSSTPSMMLKWRHKSDNRETLSASNPDKISGVQDSQGGTTSSPIQSLRSVRKRPCPSSMVAAKRMRGAAPSSSGQTSCGCRGRRVGGAGGTSTGK